MSFDLRVIHSVKARSDAEIKEIIDTVFSDQELENEQNEITTKFVNQLFKTIPEESDIWLDPHIEYWGEGCILYLNSQAGL